MGRVGVKLHLRLKSFYTALPSPAIVVAKTDTEKRFQPCGLPLPISASVGLNHQVSTTT